MHRYQRAFHMRGKVRDKVTEGETESKPAKNCRLALFDIYINHLTNLTHAELMALGFTDESAQKLNGQLIHKSVKDYKTIDPLAAYVEPTFCYAMTDAEALSDTRTFWRERAATLQVQKSTPAPSSL